MRVLAYLFAFVTFINLDAFCLASGCEDDGDSTEDSLRRRGRIRKLARAKERRSKEETEGAAKDRSVTRGSRWVRIDSESKHETSAEAIVARDVVVDRTALTDFTDTENCDDEDPRPITKREKKPNKRELRALRKAAKSGAGAPLESLASAAVAGS